MSLINKMLRDLDARHASSGQTVLPNEVRPLPEEIIPPRIGRGVWSLVGLTIVAVAALQTSAYWLPLLAESNLLPANLLPAPVAKTAPPPPATIVLQLPPPEQMLPLPTLPETPPGEAPAVAASPAQPTAPGAPELAPRQVAENRNSGLKIDSSLPDVPATQQPVAAVAAVSRAATTPSKSSAPAAKSARGGASVKIEKQQSVASPQDRAEAEYRKGVANFRQGRSSDAVAQLKGALQEDPRHLAARQTLLSLLAEQKQWDEVQSLLKEGLDLMPSQIAWAMALARIQVERGNATGAWESLQKYMNYAEKNADYQGFAGVLLQRLQKPREAALHYQAAVQIKPEEGRWWLGLGLAYEADGRAAEARDAFQHARGANGLTPEMAAVIDKKLR